MSARTACLKSSVTWGALKPTSPENGSVGLLQLDRADHVGCIQEVATEEVRNDVSIRAVDIERLARGNKRIAANP